MCTELYDQTGIRLWPNWRRAVAKVAESITCVRMLDAVKKLLRHQGNVSAIKNSE